VEAHDLSANELALCVRWRLVVAEVFRLDRDLRTPWAAQYWAMTHASG
jgi:hypothetical protein